MSKGQQTFIVGLSCAHSIIYAKPVPAIGSEVFCSRCRAYKHVLSNPVEFSAHCDDCRFSRGYGAARLTAQYGADRHAMKFPTHRVHLYLGRKRLETRASKVLQLSLLDELDKPPF